MFQCRILTVGFLLFVVHFAKSDKTECVTAEQRADGTWDFSLVPDPKYAESFPSLNIPAAAWLKDSVQENGYVLKLFRISFFLSFAFQTIKTGENFDDIIQAYWAGFLESHISTELTDAYFHNTWKGL